MRLASIVDAKSPRIVPGLASEGSVTPTIDRICDTQLGASNTMAIIGEEVINSIKLVKKGFPSWIW